MRVYLSPFYFLCLWAIADGTVIPASLMWKGKWFAEKEAEYWDSDSTSSTSQAHQHHWPQEVSPTLVCMAPILRARLLPLARPRVILGPSLPNDLPHYRLPASHPQLQGVLGCLRWLVHSCLDRVLGDPQWTSPTMYPHLLLKPCILAPKWLGPQDHHHLCTLPSSQAISCNKMVSFPQGRSRSQRLQLFRCFVCLFAFSIAC